MFTVMRLLVLMVFCLVSLAAQVVVANNQVTSTSVSDDRLRDILLGRITTWPDGSAIIIVLLDEPAATGAVRRVTGRDLPQLIRGWKRLVYAGNGAMPLVLNSRQGVLDEILRRPGSLTVLADVPNDARFTILSSP